MSHPSLLLSFLVLRASRRLARCSECRTGRRPVRRRLSLRGEAGQATAEYALVLLGAAAVALMLAAWAAKTGKLSELFDAVVDQLVGKAG